MNIRLLTIAFLGLCLLTGCKKTANGQLQDGDGVQMTITQNPATPYAELSIPQTIDLGVFTDEDAKKTTMVQVSNIGTDTLYILSAQPDCDCTTVVVVDSMILPSSNGRLEVTLDLAGYPKDSIYQEISIISNDFKDRVKSFNVMGLHK